MIKTNRLSPRLLAWGVTLLFLAIYASISLYNHYVFRTAAYDLGIKNQAIWDYANFRFNYNTIMPELNGEVNYLANHFEPALFLFGPLYWIFGSYTLLVVQILFVLLGGWGIFAYFRTTQKNDYLPVIAMATFLATWGVFAALSSDFHTNVIAAAVLPWVLYFMEKGKVLLSVLVALFMMTCKENMALWTIFIGLGMALHYRKSKLRIKGSAVISLLGFAYFLFVMKVAIPHYANGKLPYMHFNYSALGENPGQALIGLLTHPIKAIKLLFISHGEMAGTADPNLKTDLHLFVLLSGGIFLLFRPQFLVMLIPIYAQKMFSDDPSKWGIYNQYSIEFVPILVLASFTVFSALKDHRAALLAGILLFLSSFDTTKRFIDLWSPNVYYKTIDNFYKPSHYTREFPVKEMHQNLVKYIPKDVSVSATYFLVPHLAERKQVYQYPNIDNADFIAWANDSIGTYPMDSVAYYHSIDTIKSNGQWADVYENDHLVILKRNR